MVIRSPRHQNQTPSSGSNYDTNLIEQHSNRSLEQQIHRFEREIPLQESSLDERRRIFNRQREYAHDECNNLDDGKVNNDHYDRIVSRIGTILGK